MNFVSSVFNMAQAFGQSNNGVGYINSDLAQQMNEAYETLNQQYAELTGAQGAQINNLDPNLLSNYSTIMEGIANNCGSSGAAGSVFGEANKAYEEYQQEIAPYQEAMQEASDIYSVMQSGYSDEAKLKISTCKEQLDIEKEELFENYHYKFNADGTPVMDANGQPKLFGIEDQEGRQGEPQETKYEFGEGSTTITTYSYTKSTTTASDVNKSYDAATQYGDFYVRDGSPEHWENEEYVNLNFEDKQVVSDIHEHRHDQTINYSSGATEKKSYSAGETAEEKAMRKAWENKVLEEEKKKRIADKTDNGVVDKNTPTNNELKAKNAQLKEASNNLSRINSSKVLGMSRPIVEIDGQQCTLDRSLGEIINNGGTAKTVDGREVHLGNGSALLIGGSSYTYGDVVSDYNLANDSARLSEMQAQVDSLQAEVDRLNYLNTLEDEVSDLKKITPSGYQGGVNTYEEVCKNAYDDYKSNLTSAYERSGLKECEDGIKRAQANYERKVAAMRNDSGTRSSSYGDMLNNIKNIQTAEGYQSALSGISQFRNENINYSSTLDSINSQNAKKLAHDAVGYSNYGEITYDESGNPIDEYGNPI